MDRMLQDARASSPAPRNVWEAVKDCNEGVFDHEIHLGIQVRLTWTEWNRDIPENRPTFGMDLAELWSWLETTLIV